MYNNKVVQKKASIKGGVWSRILLAAMMLGMSMTGQAALIGLDLEDGPDILSEFITVEYFQSSNTLEANGFASQLLNSSTFAIDSGTFSLSALISDAGILSSGTLDIGGTISDEGFISGSLLTGNLTTLGFADDVSADGDTLEFLFDVTGGDAASLYGSTGGIILAFTGFGGDWGANFTSGQFAAAADTGVPVASVTVPEPASMWLLGSGILGLAGFARRKQKS